ncbi:unnamed protein product [Prorocentrum cordatum]|nr:unnamed protein product [Polarella glacialis]
MELWLKRESHDVGGHGPRAPPLAGVPKNASGGPEGNGALRETSGDLATRLAAVSRHALAEWPVARCHVGLLGDCAPAADGGLEGNQGRTIITGPPTEVPSPGPQGAPRALEEPSRAPLRQPSLPPHVSPPPLRALLRYRRAPGMSCAHMNWKPPPSRVQVCHHAPVPLPPKVRGGGSQRLHPRRLDARHGLRRVGGVGRAWGRARADRALPRCQLRQRRLPVLCRVEGCDWSPSQKLSRGG